MDYFRKATITSPAVIMDAKSKSALNSGISICTDTVAYKRVVSEIKEHLNQFNFTDLNIKLRVFNAQAAKAIFELLSSIRNSPRNNRTLVHWYCERSDAEMHEMASDYSELLDLDINITFN